jgi:hypothetical protein
VWATVDRRTFLVGTSAALLAQAGLGLADGSIRGQPLSGDTGWIGTAAPDPFGFAAFARQRWPELRLSRPQPDYGVDFTALFPASLAVEGAVLQLQLHDAQVTDGRALATVTNLLRWEEFSRCTGRGLLVAACQSPEGSRFFAIDSRERGLDEPRIMMPVPLSSPMRTSLTTSPSPCCGRAPALTPGFRWTTRN